MSRRTRALSLGLWVLGMLVAGVIVVRARYTADLSAFLPASPSLTQQLLVEQLREGPASRLILASIGGADAPARAALSADLAGRLRADPRFRLVSNGEAVTSDADRRYVFEHRYLLSERVTPALFEVDALHDAVAQSIELLGSPVGLLAKDLFTRDPTGETLEVIGQFDRPTRPNSSEGVWASRDGTRAILVAETVAGGADTDGQEQAITAIRTAFDAARGARPRTATDPLTLRLTGPGVFGVEARALIKNEAVRLSVLSSVLIAAFLLLVYRSLAALALGLLPVVSGGLAGVAAVALGFDVVHGVTLGFGVTLIGEAVDYSVYLLIQGGHGQRGARDEARWTRAFWPTVRLGMLTSVFGFASLIPSSFPGLAQLGLYSVTGLVVAALVTRFVLPGLLPAVLHLAPVEMPGRALLALTGRLHGGRGALLVLAVGCAAVLVQHRDTLWNAELSALSPVSQEAQAFDSRMRADLGAADVRTIVVATTGTAETALEAADAVGARLAPLVAAGELAGYDTPTRYLPSLATQRQRAASLPPPAVLRARFAAAISTLPVDPSRFEEFYADVERARQAQGVTRADMAHTAASSGVDALLIRHGGHYSALIPLQALHGGAGAFKVDVAKVSAALASIGPVYGAIVVLDLKRESDALYAGYLAEARRLSLAGLVSILLLLAVALRSVKRVVRVVLPLVLAVLVVMTGFALAGHALTILHLVGLLLIVAIGSNYALFFDREATGQDATERVRTVASLLVANTTTVLGFGVLALSSVPVLAAVGSTVAPGALLALLFAAVLA